jgi:hypothetical protein
VRGNCKFPARPTDSSRFIHLQVGNAAGQPSANRGVRWFRYRTCETALPFVCAMLDRICTCTRRFCARPLSIPSLVHPTVVYFAEILSSILNRLAERMFLSLS